MNKKHKISGDLKKFLLLFLVLLLGVSCAPVSSSPHVTVLPRSTATPLSTPQNTAVSPELATPTPIVTPQPTLIEWQDQIIYVLIPHKFYDGDRTNNFMRDKYKLPNSNYVGGFLGGDIAGIRQQMPYLKSLGITAVLIYPVLCNDENPFLNRLPGGYNVRDYRCIDPNFGTIEEFSELIEEFHSTSNGPRIDVLLDLPISATGHEHPWRQNPEYYRLWNYGNPQDNVGCNTSYCVEYRLPDGTPVDNSLSLPILDHKDGMDTGTGMYAAVRDTIFWLVDNFDIDGIRYDSAQNFHPAFWPKFMGDFHSRYAQTRPNFWHIAEVINPIPKKTWQIPSAEFINPTSSVGPIAMDGIYDFPLITHIPNVFAEGTDPNCIPAFGQCVNLLQHLTNTDNVEDPERMMASLDFYELRTFLSLVSDDNGKAKLHLAAAFLMTINRIPLIYSGNECGIDYTDPGTLFDSGLDPSYCQNFKKLVELRRDNAAFRWGSLTSLDTPGTIISYARQHEGKTFVVVLNNSASGQSTVISLGAKEIPCFSITNLLVENDPSIQLNNPGTNSASLSLTFNAWEPKIMQCAEG